MAPRKRRNRTPVSAIPTPDSGSNSLVTSSSSPNRNSRSDDNESDKVRSKRLSSTEAPMSPSIDSTQTTPMSSQLTLSQPAQHAFRQSSSGRASAIFSMQSCDARAVMAAANATAENVISGDSSRFTVASVALRLYDQLIDWAVLQVAIQYKHHAYVTAEERRRAGAFPSTGQRATSRISIVPGSFGSRLLFSEKNVTVECSNCSINISASRYAQHVEKCLGRGGRMSSRAASARLRASAERAEKDATDADDVSSRRRRLSSSTTADHDGISSGSASHSHKRRKVSPAHSAGTASLHSSLNSRGLPPSGRTRASPK